MNLDNVKTKVKDLCRRIGKRNFIIFGAVALTIVAVAINLIIFNSGKDDGFDYGQSAGMNTDGASTQDGNKEPEVDKDSKDTYFSSVQIDRQRTRDEAIEVLRSVVENEASTEAAKNDALAQISKLAAVMEAEANIETLVEAKGFSECVAVISDDGASIVVSSDGLLPAQISQINEIVYAQAGIEPINVKIIER